MVQVLPPENPDLSLIIKACPVSLFPEQTDLRGKCWMVWRQIYTGSTDESVGQNRMRSVLPEYAIIAQEREDIAHYKVVRVGVVSEKGLQSLLAGFVVTYRLIFLPAVFIPPYIMCCGCAIFITCHAVDIRLFEAPRGRKPGSKAD